MEYSRIIRMTEPNPLVVSTLEDGLLQIQVGEEPQYRMISKSTLVGAPYTLQVNR